MCVVFQFWDLRRLPFSFLHHHQARPSISPDISDTLVQDEFSGHRKGFEAPRNSLELNSCILEAASSSSSNMKKYDENLKIHEMKNIKTNNEIKSPRKSISIYCAKNEEILLLSSSSSEFNSNSPGIKPPNLVARLMGLDLVPEQTGSPSSFSRQSTSPSLSNRTQSTHHHHHDVSGTVSLPETPRISLARKSDVDHHHHHRLSLQCSKARKSDDHRLSLQCSKARKPDVDHHHRLSLQCSKAGKSDGDHHRLSLQCSKAGKSDVDHHRLSLQCSKAGKSDVDHHHRHSLQCSKAGKSDVDHHHRHSSQCSKENIDDDDEDRLDVSILEEEESASQYACYSSRTYNKEILAINLLVQSEEEYYLYYIQRILKRIGIDKDTPVSLAKWYSPSQPIDPSVFRYLELFNQTGFGPSSRLNRRCERKLVFHLVDELLVEILSLDSWGFVKRETFLGSELIDALCEKIREFPGANCRVLEDIDALIELDFKKSERSDELENVVIDIERDIIDKIIHETVMEVYDIGCT